MINTIGPVWDGNEVWLLVAGGATFAAFPEWYATLFSGFYLPLLLILVALIVRGVAFEYRGKIDTDRWRARWDRAIVDRLVRARPAVGRGVRQHRARRPDRRRPRVHRQLLHPAQPVRAARRPHHAVAVPRCTAPSSSRSRPTATVRAARPADGRPASAPVALVVAGAFAVWTQLAHGKGWTWLPWPWPPSRWSAPSSPTRAAREGWAFPLTTVVIVAAVVLLFGIALPRRPAVDHRPRRHPHHHQRLVDAVHADRDDLGGGGLHAARPALPGLDATGCSASGSAAATCPARAGCRRSARRV